MFCSGRPEGFGLQSPHSFLPTTCFVDTILVPLPTFILILTIPTIFLFSRLFSPRRRHNSPTKHHRIDSESPSGNRRARKRCCYGIGWERSRSLWYKVATTIYYFFIAVNFFMQILELARLGAIHFSLALLPLILFGLLLAGMVHYTQGFYHRLPKWEVLNIFFWIASMVMTAIKTAGLVQEGMHDERKGSGYPVVDQYTDTAVIAGVYGVLAVLEAGLWVSERKRRKARVHEGVSDGSGSGIGLVDGD